MQYSYFIFKNNKIKRIIDLLKDESSANLSILNDLYIFANNSLIFNYIYINVYHIVNINNNDN